MSLRQQIETNLHRVQQRIADACQRAGRSGDSVQLVAVTKYAQLPWVQTLVELGQTVLGESRPQQLSQRATELSGDISWHLIGHLQRNKVSLVLPIADVIHSVDSWRLLERVNQSARELGQHPRVLLEVNVSGEASKDGLSIHDVKSEASRLANYENVSIDGLMTMAPLVGEVEDTRPYFRSLRQLRDKLVEQSAGRHMLPYLSMGMSRDFEIAIEEGATFVRVGSDLFEGL